MKAEVAKIWVDALRSGEYTQGRAALKNVSKQGYEHCCLGVLCELYDKYNEEKLIRDTGYNLAKDKITCSFDMETELLPEKVREWAGLSNKRASFKSGFESLVVCNDIGNSFETIANIIEQNVDSL